MTARRGIPPPSIGPAAWVIVLIVLANLALWGGIVFVVAHFIAKWW